MTDAAIARMLTRDYDLTPAMTAKDVREVRAGDDSQRWTWGIRRKYGEDLAASLESAILQEEG